MFLLRKRIYLVLFVNEIACDWFVVASAISALLAGLSLVLNHKAAAPFVSKINVNVADFGTRIKPTRKTVSVVEVFATYKASSVHDKVPLGVGGLEPDNVL